MSHPRWGLDDAFQTPVRLSIMASLHDGAELDFSTLRDLLEVDLSALSKAIAHLERVGYVSVRKGYANNRPRTWVSSTQIGKKALKGHVRALQSITNTVGT